MYIDLSRYLVFILVMFRMTGLLVFNPIFGRSNVPVMLNAAFAFVLAILITGATPFPPQPDPTMFSFFYMALKELAVGMIAGFVLRMFMAVLIIGGEVVDMQMGVGMSKLFDPASNASISLSSSIFNIFFTLLFFHTNAHLTLISMTANTFQLIPLGVSSFNMENAFVITELFTDILILSVKICMPITVIEIIVTFAVGMIMRIIPQINVFVVNIQLKLFIGMLVMIILVPPFIGFFENLITLSFDNIQQIWMNFA